MGCPDCCRGFSVVFDSSVDAVKDNLPNEGSGIKDLSQSLMATSKRMMRGPRKGRRCFSSLTNIAGELKGHKVGIGHNRSRDVVEGVRGERRCTTEGAHVTWSAQGDRGSSVWNMQEPGLEGGGGGGGVPSDRRTYSVGIESKIPLSSTTLTVSGFLTCAQLYNTKGLTTVRVSDHSTRFIGQ